MDRAAAEVVPPFEWSATRTVALAGLALVGVAAALGGVATAIGAEPGSLLHTPRLLALFAGAIVAGAALSMRPDLPAAWALACGTAALAVPATPAHWDSFRLLFGVAAAVAGASAAVRYAPPKFRPPAVTALILFHFGGIFLATTTPPSTPWVTEQVFTRVYNPYLQFLYLRNAYHFYSPEPGPASLLVFCLKTETEEKGRKVYTTKWVVTPTRPGDVRDPLGVTYYRRLSISEQTARASPGLLTTTPAERAEVEARRAQHIAIPPPAPAEMYAEYRLPHPEISRFVIPSYASHVVLQNTKDKDEAARTTVKMYRIEHIVLPVEAFVNARNDPNPITDPYHPVTYRPFFLGEFDARGTLLDPQEPMLYWLVPIRARPNAPKDAVPYLDYLSLHALGLDGQKGPVVFDDPTERARAFDWARLR
jgi:hypothetical protein